MNFGNIAVLNMTASNEELILSESLIFCLKTFELDCPHHHNWVVTSVEEERNASCLISRAMFFTQCIFLEICASGGMTRCLLSHVTFIINLGKCDADSHPSPMINLFFFLIEPAAAHRRPQVG